MNFEKDHRESNPGLHRLYVRWALEILGEAQPAMEALFNRSNWNASQIASAMQEQIQKLVTTDAAFAEAAALLYCNADTSDYFVEDDGTAEVVETA